MKKLTLALSALAAVFGVSSANADVSVSGSGSVAYVSPATSGADGEVAVGQFVSFGLSTTTASGMTISGGMGLSNTLTTNNSQAVSGGKTLTFASGGASLTIGDVEVADTPGSVGGLVGDQVDDLGDLDSKVATGFADDDGLGFTFSTAVGSSTLSLGYVANTGADNYGAINGASITSVMAAGVSMPMGAYTLNIGMASADGTDESSAGASISGSIGAGTLTVGYSTQTLDESAKDTAAAAAFASANATARTAGSTAATEGDLSADGDSVVMGATYSMSIDADTSLAIGYQNAKDADDESHTQFDATVSRALGGGASVFLEMRNLAGDTDQDGTAIAVGSRVSF
jgi:hypothetical protein